VIAGFLCEVKPKLVAEFGVRPSRKEQQPEKRSRGLCVYPGNKREVIR
jgi:hypothetical protein